MPYPLPGGRAATPASSDSQSGVSVDPFHLFRDLDGQAYRYNQRKITNGERFLSAVAGS